MFHLAQNMAKQTVLSEPSLNREERDGELEGCNVEREGGMGERRGNT